MKINTWKDAVHLISLGNCKLRQQCDTTVYLLRWLKPKTLTTPNAVEEMKQQELSCIAGGNTK